MKRSPLDLATIADHANLLAAFHRAAKGKADRHEVHMFRMHLDRNIDHLRADILSGCPDLQPMRRFQIFDPKPRLIHAPVFRERVLHHALIAHVGPVLDRSLVFDTYACREGKGTIAAVQRAQHFARRFAWFGQIDIKSYFASIDHAVLQNLLRRRFKDKGLLRFLDRIIAAHDASAGCGLPIGALTSQHLANFYLSGLDRFLLEQCQVRGMVRYMDDVVWWADDKDTIRTTMGAVRAFVQKHRKLDVKQPVRMGPVAGGLSFCGFRILPGVTLLSRRRKARYAAARSKWESAYALGQVTAMGLQAGYASALGMTAAADAGGWRRAQLSRVPLAMEVSDV